MCGRYSFIPKDDFYDRFKIENKLEKLETHYNVAPGMLMPVILRQSPNQVVLMRWGLIPSWAKDPKIGYNLINARVESIKDKPSFKKAFLTQRCLIPTSGFFEWKHIGDDKVPYFIRLKNRKMFAFAGLYDSWKDAEGYPLRTFTIITTTPNLFLATIHHRMPVILKEEVEDIWLDRNITNVDRLLDLLKPDDSMDLEAYAVSKVVNNPVNDNEEVIKALI